MSEWNEKMAAIAACIRSDKRIQAMLKKEAKMRWEREARRVVPKGWRLYKRRKRTMKRAKAGRPRRKIKKVVKPVVLGTPICDRIIAQHRAEIKAKLIAEGKLCVCKKITEHWLKCGTWVPLKQHKEAA